MNDDTYVLAAGSMEGPDEIYAISTSGQSSTLQLEDPEVETFEQFDAGGGRIYYVDGKKTLKAFAPGTPNPRLSSKGQNYRF